MIGRRGFMRMIPALGLGARAAAAEAAATLAGVGMFPASHGNSNWGEAGGSPCGAPPNIPVEARKVALRNPSVRSKVESHLFQLGRRVTTIDPDIAVLRSFSLNAKITFQRQRNVAASLKDMTDRFNSWDAIENAIREFMPLT